MKVYQGDTIYNYRGEPGVVTGRDSVTGTLTAEKNGEVFENTRKYGFLNGLKPGERKAFYSIIDKVREIEGGRERVGEIIKQIEELEKDPRNFNLVKYLRAEQAHIMYAEGITPKTYKMDELKL